MASMATTKKVSLNAHWTHQSVGVGLLGIFASFPRTSQECLTRSTAPLYNCQLSANGFLPFAQQDTKRLEETLMKTFSAKPHEVTHDWFVVDATDKVLGRLASEIARRLRGKHKAIYTPHVDTGDFIVVVNVEKLRVTGDKAQDKKYYRHTGYPGGIYETNFTKLQQRFPARVLEKAVKGMLPKGPLGYAMLKKLKCYAGGEHPHSAQQPKVLDI